jgi:hypothetical protein
VFPLTWAEPSTHNLPCRKVTGSRSSGTKTKLPQPLGRMVKQPNPANVRWGQYECLLLGRNESLRRGERGTLQTTSSPDSDTAASDRVSVCQRWRVAIHRL